MAWWSRTGWTRGALRLLGSTGSFGEFLRGPHGGQDGRGTTGDRETPRRRGSPAARSDRNPGAGRGANSELRLPGVPRGLGDSAAQLAGDRGMAGRRGHGGAGASRGGAARAGGARASCGCGRARWGAGEGQGAFKKGWPGISACARGKEIPGDLAGRFGAVAWSREGKERGGADGWGRSVSGGRRRAGRVAGLLRDAGCGSRPALAGPKWSGTRWRGERGGGGPGWAREWAAGKGEGGVGPVYHPTRMSAR